MSRITTPFQWFALDVPTLGLDLTATRDEVIAAREGHLLAAGQIVVTFNRSEAARGTVAADLADAGFSRLSGIALAGMLPGIELPRASALEPLHPDWVNSDAFGISFYTTSKSQGWRFHPIFSNREERSSFSRKLSEVQAKRRLLGCL